MKQHKIDIVNNQTKIKGTRELRKAVKDSICKTLEFEGFDKIAEISVCFTDNEEIKDLNSDFRSKDTPTDILSFPSGDYPSDDKEIFLGDIIISLERADEQSTEYGNSLYEEVSFLTSHSVLHLLGYDHMTEADAKIMFEKQDTVMTLLGLSRKTD